MKDSTNYRKDYRTTEQFKKDIKRRTAKEKFLVELFVKEAEYRGRPVTIEDNGIDNTGKLVKKSSCDADYLLTYNGKSDLLEIKCSPVSHKCTFKVYHLQQYVKQGANILLFYGVGKIDKDPTKIDYENTRWAIITPKKIQKMLDEHTPYEEYMFGNKICIKVEQKNYDKYFTSYKLRHVA